MIRPALRLLPFALLVTLSAFGQTNPTPSQIELQARVANLMKINGAWGPSASTPNMSLTIKETSRSGQTIKFGLSGEGLPKDKTYSIVSWPITQDKLSKILSGVTFNSSGVAICAGIPNTCAGEKPDDPINLVAQPVSGEPIRFGVISDDGAIKLFAKIVPLPLKGEDRGCTVEAVLLTPDATLLWIEGSGFAPDSEVTFEGDSEGERQSHTAKTDPGGRYISSVLPYKQGIAQGTIKITLRSTKCSPSVSVPWGKRN